LVLPRPVQPEGSLGSGGGGEELGDGKAGHDRGADLGQGGEEVQAVHPAGRPDRQHGTFKPRATPGLRAETPLAPQDGRPDGAFSQVVGGLDLGDIQAVQRAGRRWSTPSRIRRTLASAGPMPWVRSSQNPDCIRRERNW